MAGHRKPMIDIQKIIQLKLNGESNRRIAALMSVDRKTVGDYVLRLISTGKSFQILATLDEAALQALFPVTNTIVKDDAYKVSVPRNRYSLNCERLVNLSIPNNTSHGITQAVYKVRT